MKDKPKYMTEAQKGQMARELVYYCLRRLTFYATWAMILKTVALAFDRTIDLSDVMLFIGGAFGGELLMLLAKRILAKSTEEESENEDA